MSDETTNEGTVGVGLFVAAYVDERGADQGLGDLKQAKKGGNSANGGPAGNSPANRSG